MTENGVPCDREWHRFETSPRSEEGDGPDYDVEMAANMALALLWLNMHRDKYSTRAWKGMPWDLLDNLFERGLISDPQSKAKSVVVFPDGEALAKNLFEKHFRSSSALRLVDPDPIELDDPQAPGDVAARELRE